MSHEMVHLAQERATGWHLAMPAGKRRGFSGGVFGRRQGASHEFLEHRDYLPGDDIRRIDWKAFARSDRLTVKCYQEEVAPGLDLLLDSSASMGFDENKKNGVLALAAFVAQVAANSGFAVRAWFSGAGFERFPDDRGQVAQWIWPEFTGKVSPLAAWQHKAPKINSNGLVVFISDLLTLEDPSHLVAHLGREAAQVTVLQVLTANEERPQFSGATRLSGAEGGRQDLIADSKTIERYVRMLTEHRRQWQQACQSHGAAFASVTAEDFTTTWLVPELIEAGILAPR